MVYKKYIKRNGKVFGPYYYESYRENGVVKTRFISGPTKSDVLKDKIKDKRNYFIFGFLFLLILVVGWVKSDSIYTGRAVWFFDPYGYECVPDIVCTPWTDCFDENDDGIGFRNKTCLDLNSCTHDSGITEEVETCLVDLIEEPDEPAGETQEAEEIRQLVCGEWSECESNYNLYNLGKGFQKRICRYGEEERIDKRECDIKEEVLVRKVSDDEMQIYDAEDKKPIARIVKGVNKVDIDLGDLV